MRGIIIEVEKIQRYVYHRIDERRAEYQHDSKTLQEIVFSSGAVSKDILGKIEDKFEIYKKDSNTVLLWISGKVIFFSNLEQKDISQRLKELHRDIYLEYGGNIQLRYTSFSSEATEDKMKIIQSAKRALNIEKKKNTNILDIKEELFCFQELTKIPMKQGVSYTDGVFARNMDALIRNNNKKENESTDGKIAIVKADINNMGKIFSEIKDYSQYDKLSKLLVNKISVDYFRILVQNYKKYDLTEKILPLYIEGDDVFYAVQIEALLASIDLLRKMIKEINEDIETDIQSEIKLGIAVGVIFTNNHQPIRYYREMVEKELSIIKEKMKIEKTDRVDLGVSLAANLFYSYRGNLGISEKDGFSKFSQEIEEIKWLKSHNAFSNSFIFNLLRVLESSEKDTEQQLRHLLYFLIPDVQKTEKSKYDLLFKYYLLSQVVEDKKESKENKPEERLFDARKINSILIPKLKLVLLLTDDRFVTLDKNKDCKFKSIIRKENYSKQVENIIRVMFTKPLNYLIEFYCPKKENNRIEAIFISRENPKIDGNIITVYKKVPLHVTMLFRMKKFMEQKKYDQIERLIINYFKQNEADFEKLKKDRQEEGKKVEYRKEFNQKKFRRYFKEIKKLHKADWLDNLILFYKYDEQRMKKEEAEKYLLEFKKI